MNTKNTKTMVVTRNFKTLKKIDISVNRSELELVGKLWDHLSHQMVNAKRVLSA